jgi:hypothetical protein
LHATLLLAIAKRDVGCCYMLGAHFNCVGLPVAPFHSHSHRAQRHWRATLTQAGDNSSLSTGAAPLNGVGLSTGTDQPSQAGIHSSSFDQGGKAPIDDLEGAVVRSRDAVEEPREPWEEPSHRSSESETLTQTQTPPTGWHPLANPLLWQVGVLAPDHLDPVWIGPAHSLSRALRARHTGHDWQMWPLTEKGPTHMAQGTEDEAMFQGAMPVQLTPPWKVGSRTDGRMLTG